MTTNKLPAFHVGEYLADELEARGWTTGDCALRMEGDGMVNKLAIDMLIMASHIEPRIAKKLKYDALIMRLARVLGVEAQTLLNIDKSWRDFHA